MNASNYARFDQSYREIAVAAKLPGVDDPKVDVLGLVFRYLEGDNSGEWLMVLDNADDANVFFHQKIPHVPQIGGEVHDTRTLSSYLPQNAKGSILISSRDRNAAFRLAGKDDRIINVAPMGKETANKLLARKLPRDPSDEETRNILLDALEYLPLAITQAAAYIAVKAPRMTISKYLDFFRQNESSQVSLLSKDGGDPRRDPEVPNSVMTTWEISFDQIKDQNASAAGLLSCMCVLERQGIPGFLFCQDDSDSLEFEDSIGTLIEFSFVAAEKDDSIFQMHRLVQLAMRKWLEMHDELEKRKEEMLSLLSDNYPRGVFENWKTCEALEPHAQAVLSYDYAPPQCKLEQAKILHHSAQYADDQGKYEVARGKVQEAVNIRKTFLGTDDPHTLHSLSLLASVYEKQGLWKMAEDLKMEVMKTNVKICGQEHLNTLTSMGNLAPIYRRQGLYKKAEEFETQVMETRIKVLGREHPYTLTRMSNLAITYRSQNRLNEAEDLLMEVLKTRKKVLGQEHPYTLTSMNNLALTYLVQERLKEAEDLQVEVLKTRERVLRQEHPKTLTSMNNLAHTWKRQGRDKEAITLMKQAASLQEKVLGSDHPDTKNFTYGLEIWQSQQRAA